MTRIRSAAQRAPQSTEAATALLSRFAALSADVKLIETVRTAAIAAANSSADAELVPIVAELKNIAAQLKPWWTANRDELTAGKRKSIELGGCVIGDRVGNPTLKFEHGTDADGIEALCWAGRAGDFVREKPTLDKPALLAAIDAEPADETIPLELLGFYTAQTESFFVDVAGSDAAKISAT